MRKAVVRSIGNSFTFEVAEMDASVENSRYKEGQRMRFKSCNGLLHEIREFLEGEFLRSTQIFKPDTFRDLGEDVERIQKKAGRQK